MHTATNSVNTLTVQLAKAFGAGRVIATTSTTDKLELALELGTNVTLDPTTNNLSTQLHKANNNKRVNVMFKITNKKVFNASLDTLTPFKHLVAYNDTSKKPNQITTNTLIHKSKAIIKF